MTGVSGENSALSELARAIWLELRSRWTVWWLERHRRSTRRLSARLLQYRRELDMMNGREK